MMYEKMSKGYVEGPSQNTTMDYSMPSAELNSGPRNLQGRKEESPNEETRAEKYPKISLTTQFKAVFGMWVNILLVCVPIGIAMNYAKSIGGAGETHSILVFVFNFTAIVPLAAILSLATEELALYIGEVMGGLLNASFGNAVELIIGIIALAKGEILIVQTSLIGSMLSNLLLVMGMCFFFGGLNRTEQCFNHTVANTASSLLAVAIGSLIIPAAFVGFAEQERDVVPPSRGTAVMLLFVYGCYLLFQLKTHSDICNEPSQKAPKMTSGKSHARKSSEDLAIAVDRKVEGGNILVEKDEKDEIPQLSIVSALVTLAGATVLIALCAESMVGAIDDVSKNGVSREFIGLILLPIVGNAAEHATAVTVAIKDKMDLAIGVAIGSSLQIALLVLPLMVLLSWFGIGEPTVMSLDFDGFHIAVLFISIILVNYLIQDGRSNWLEGVMLQIIYFIIAVMAWFYPAGKVAG